MTYTEAAQTVLLRAGKPLHYKDITALAIDWELIKAVGKNPDVTMRTHLSDSIKKNPKSPFVRMRPGFFGLQEY